MLRVYLMPSGFGRSLLAARALAPCAGGHALQLPEVKKRKEASEFKGGHPLINPGLLGKPSGFADFVYASDMPIPYHLVVSCLNNG